MGEADDIGTEFLIEARELLDGLGEQMVALERAPDDLDALNAVFRAFHTIKGGAGFLGLEPMVALCHAVEDRISLARSGEAPLDTAAFDGAQEALDLLEAMLRELGAGRPLSPPPATLLARLAGRPEGPRHGPAASTAPPASAGGDLDDLDFEALLDTLHGVGGVPGAKPTPPPPQAPSVATATAPAAPPAPLPSAPAAKTAAEATEATVRVDVRRLDNMVNLVGELVLARNRLKTLRPGLRNEELDRAVAALDVATSRLQSAVMMTRMQPVGRVFARFPKLARDVARQLHKSVELEVVGAETELDRNLVEALADPLVHLVRNAIDHGIEAPEARLAAGKPAQGRVRLSAQQEGDHVAIEVRDDGAGMDPEALRRAACEKGLLDREAAARLSPEECLQLVFLPGFSTKTEVSDLSGRGVGMDVVHSRIRELSGQVQIHSEPGQGTRFVIRVPLTLAILPTLLVEVGQDVYALPLVRVIEVLALEPGPHLQLDGRPVLDLRRQPVPLLSLRDWLGLADDGRAALTGVVVQSGEQRYCLLVDRVRGREEVVIKALPRTLRGLPGYAGASLIGDGRMALILDVDAVFATGVRASSRAAAGR